MTRNIFREKVCRKPAVKTSSMRLLNLVISPKQSMHIWEFWKQVIFKRDLEKGNLIFSFALSGFLWAKFWKAKMPGTSYQSLWVARHAYKNSFFGLTLLIWKLWKEKGKNNKRLNTGKKIFKIIKMLSFGKIWKIEDASFTFEYSDSLILMLILFQ